MSPCLLFESDCTTPYTANNIFINTVSNWNLDARRDTVAGYSDTICYMCTD